MKMRPFTGVTTWSRYCCLTLRGSSLSRSRDTSDSKSVSLLHTGAPCFKTKQDDPLNKKNGIISEKGRTEPRVVVRPKFGKSSAALSVIPVRDLCRAWFVYQLFRFNFLVDRSEKLLKLSQRLLGEKLFNRFMRATVYGQFVGGESIQDLKKVIAALKAHGIYPVLDYAVEKDIADAEEVSLEKRQMAKETSVSGDNTKGTTPKFKSTQVKARVIKRASARTHFYSGEKECDNNLNAFLQSLTAAAECSVGTTAFVAIKLTALGRPEFLLELAEVLTRTRQEFNDIVASSSSSPQPSSPSSPAPAQRGRGQTSLSQDQLESWLRRIGIDCSGSEVQRIYREMDLDRSGSVDLLDWLKFFEPGNKPHDVFLPLKDNSSSSYLYLSKDGRRQMKNMLDRAHTIAQRATDLGVRMMVDAEQSYYQPAIRHIAVGALMPAYNLSTPVVYSTIQSYLKDSPSVIEEDVAISKRWRFYYGVKLVRGAYLEQERERAREMGYPSPLHDTKEDTDRCYNANVSKLLQEAGGGLVSMMVASHNERSASHAVQEMSRLGIPPHDGTVTFGQLYGMCDHVSLTLGQSGYEVYKYLPYGPISEVMPYLIRRAYENRAMMKAADGYRILISQELFRRIRNGFARP